MANTLLRLGEIAYTMGKMIEESSPNDYIELF